MLKYLHNVHLLFMYELNKYVIKLINEILFIEYSNLNQYIGLYHKKLTLNS